MVWRLRLSARLVIETLGSLEKLNQGLKDQAEILIAVRVRMAQHPTMQALDKVFKFVLGHLPPKAQTKHGFVTVIPHSAES